MAASNSLKSPWHRHMAPDIKFLKTASSYFLGPVKFLILGSKTNHVIILIFNVVRGCFMRIQDVTGAALLSSKMWEAQLSENFPKIFNQFLYIHKLSTRLHDIQSSSYTILNVP
jgi:hypothetical protein